jgi:nucleotide-binding universal stress UspA family protein
VLRGNRKTPQYSPSLETVAPVKASEALSSSDWFGITFAPSVVGSNRYFRREEHAMLPIHTILHATDFSQSSEFAFRLACALARDYGANLVILHVVPAPPIVGYAEGILVPEPAESFEDLHARLNELRPTDPEIVVERRVVEGDAAIEILRSAKETGCNLIVIGTHGRSGLPRLLMGSVAEHVMRRAECPVLTVRQPFEETVVTGQGMEMGAHA